MSRKLLFHELMKTHVDMSFICRSEPFKLKSIAFILLYQSLMKFYFHLYIHQDDGILKHRKAINTLRWIEA